MKKILLTIVGLAAGLAAFAQGTVNLNNNFTPTGGTAKALILALDGTPLSKALGSVEILDSTGAVLKSGSIASPGIFGFGVTTIPNTVDGKSTITIRAWDNSTGATYDLATVRNSVLVSLTGITQPPTPPLGLGTVGNFTGFTLTQSVVPEPSTYALAALGLVGMFFVARDRKSVV